MIWANFVYSGTGYTHNGSNFDTGLFASPVIVATLKIMNLLPYNYSWNIEFAPRGLLLKERICF